MPLVAKQKCKTEVVKIDQPGKTCPLTADVDRVPECGGDLRIELDNEVALLGHIVVAPLDKFRHPCTEGFAYEGVDHVDDPLSRQSVDISIIGEVVLDALHLLALLQDGFDREALVHGDEQDLDINSWDDYIRVRDRRRYLHFLVPRTRSLRK